MGNEYSLSTGKGKPMAEQTISKALWIPQVVVIVLLLVAFNPGNPYGYYIGLRWACCGCFSYLAYRAWEKHLIGWTWTLAIVAIAYNPFFRIHLGREIWSAVNVVTIGIAVGSIFAFKKAAHSKRVESEG